MATDVDRLSGWTRILAAACLVVIAGSVALLAARGLRPMDDQIAFRAGEFALTIRERMGARSLLASLIEWCINALYMMIPWFLVVAQAFLGIYLLLASIAVLVGDWTSRWDIRRWSGLTLIVDGLGLVISAGQDFGSWLRLGLAVIVIWSIERAPNIVPLSELFSREEPE